MPETMEQKLSRYRTLKAQIEALEEQKKAILGEFKAGLDAFGVESIRIQTEEGLIQIRSAHRDNKKCDWALLQELNPELYARVVSVNPSDYVDIRRVNEPANRRARSTVTIETPAEEQAA